MTDSTPLVHRWKNCYSDVLSHAYDRTAQAFLDAVIRPAFAALDARLQALRADEDPSVVFVIADHEVLREQTALALTLAIQSIWERQLRAYVGGCAGELKIAQAIKQSTSNVWKDVEDAFELTRGIPLSEMPRYADLSLLHVLGSVCRHGPGKSLATLWRDHEELWPTRADREAAAHVFSSGAQPEQSPTLSGLTISLEILERFTSAIVEFWNEANYIYMESIERKHESLERQLGVMREERRLAVRTSEGTP
jgi:hypothetical protein